MSSCALPWWAVPGAFPVRTVAASCYLLEADGFRLVIDFGNGSLGALQRYTGAVRRRRRLPEPPARRPLRRPVLLLDRPDLLPGRAAAADPGLRAGRHRRADRPHPRPGRGRRACTKRFAFETLAAGQRGDRPVRRRARAHEPPGGDVRLPVHPRRPDARLHRRHRRDGGGRRRWPRDADVFLSEAAFLDGPGLPPDLHLTARQAGAYATRAGVGRLVLTHLQPWTTRTPPARRRRRLRRPPGRGRRGPGIDSARSAAPPAGVRGHAAVNPCQRR